MGVWKDFVDFIYATLVGLSTIFGGNMGLAIGMLSLSVRLALLPWTLRLARRSLEVQHALKKLEPAISIIRKKHKDDPQRILEETAILHQQHGIRILDASSLVGMLMQMPLFLGVFAAVRRGLSGAGRFLWIKDLMKSDPLLAGVCAILTGMAVALAPNASVSHRAVAITLPAALTFLFLWRVSAGIAIYSFSSTLVGAIQALMIRRRAAVS